MISKRMLGWVILCFLAGEHRAIAQGNHYTDTANLVPNGGFEEHSGFPLGWYYRGEDFTELVRFWSSPTAASPDAYGPEVIVPSSWGEKGFGKSRAYQGDGYAGITVYGCDEGKPHCREYIQVPFIEPLVAGQRYRVTLQYKWLPGVVRIGQLGLRFEPAAIDQPDEQRILREPQIELPLSEGEQWTVLSSEWTAVGGATHLIIGNFRADEDGVRIEASLPYSYLYLDEIRLQKLPPIVSADATPEGLYTDRDLDRVERGVPFQLNTIYFDTDKYDFHPRSFEQLVILQRYLSTHPHLDLEIRGHTDNQGDYEHNVRLSFSRAEAVASYLMKHDISGYRLQYQGYADSDPVADNSTLEGRQLNRRVEFLLHERR